MFEHFTFGAQPQTHFHQPEELSASPTDTTCLPLPAPSTTLLPEPSASPSMTVILDKLTQRTLVPDENTPPLAIMSDASPTIANEDALYGEYESTYMPARHGLIKLKATPPIPTSSSPRPTSPCKRVQRQLNSQLQTCTSHVKDITTLVEDMISSNSQCTVHAAPTNLLSAPIPPPIELDPLLVPLERLEADEDEGFSELDDLQALELIIRQQEQDTEESEIISLYRASTPSGIRKSGIERKLLGLYYTRAGGDSDLGTNGAAKEHGKVMSKPRMRRRKGCDARRKEKI